MVLRDGASFYQMEVQSQSQCRLVGSAISVTMKGFFKNAVIFRPVYLLIFDIVLFKNKPKQ